jgi:glycerol-3-phosphate dehydrogenase
VSSYGASWPDVWKAVSADAVTSARVVEACIYRMGELRYACEVEMAQTLADLLIRRTRVAFETKDHGVESAERVATYVAPLLGWNGARISTEVARYRGDVDRMFRIDPR